MEFQAVKHWHVPWLGLCPTRFINSGIFACVALSQGDASKDIKINHSNAARLRFIWMAWTWTRHRTKLTDDSPYYVTLCVTCCSGLVQKIPAFSPAWNQVRSVSSGGRRQFSWEDTGRQVCLDCIFMEIRLFVEWLCWDFAFLAYCQTNYWIGAALTRTCYSNALVCAMFAHSHCMAWKCNVCLFCALLTADFFRMLPEF